MRTSITYRPEGHLPRRMFEFGALHESTSSVLGHRQVVTVQAPHPHVNPPVRNLWFARLPLALSPRILDLKTAFQLSFDFFMIALNTSSGTEIERRIESDKTRDSGINKCWLLMGC